jgi:hypothetical protein
MLDAIVVSGDANGFDRLATRFPRVTVLAV